MRLALDCIGVIMEYNGSGRVASEVMLLNRDVEEYIIYEHPHCMANVIFNLNMTWMNDYLVNSCDNSSNIKMNMKNLKMKRKMTFVFCIRICDILQQFRYFNFVACRLFFRSNFPNLCSFEIQNSPRSIDFIIGDNREPIDDFERNIKTIVLKVSKMFGKI